MARTVHAGRPVKTPPMYTVTLVRDGQVVRERRLYGRASAEMVAEGWCQSNQPLSPTPTARESGRRRA